MLDSLRKKCNLTNRHTSGQDAVRKTIDKNLKEMLAKFVYYSKKPKIQLSLHVDVQLNL